MNWFGLSGMQVLVGLGMIFGCGVLVELHHARKALDAILDILIRQAASRN